MENKARPQSRKKKSKPSPKNYVDYALRTLRNNLLMHMADAYCAVWDICRGSYANRNERAEARAKALDTIALAMFKSEGIMAEMEVRK